MKIAIVFGDNDFLYTFSGVLTTLGEVISSRDGEYDFSLLDKEKIAEIINELSFSHYVIYQSNSLDFNDKERTKEYLKIDSSKIRLNEEVEKLEWNNGETFILEVYPKSYGDKYYVYSM